MKNCRELMKMKVEMTNPPLNLNFVQIFLKTIQLMNFRLKDIPFSFPPPLSFIVCVFSCFADQICVNRQFITSESKF